MSTIPVIVAIICLLQAAQAIQISEIMYHPATDEARSEWLELYNEAPSRRDISLWRFTKGIEYIFPEGTIMEPGEYIVVASDPNALQFAYDIAKVFGPYEDRLSNSGEKIVLSDTAGAAMVEVRYDDRHPWPIAPDGTGHSLTKDRLRGLPSDPQYWRASRFIGGTPGGTDEPIAPTPRGETVIQVGDSWTYFKGRAAPSPGSIQWTSLAFDDSSGNWLTGPTGIGYGDGDDATVLSDMRNNYISLYCRRVFTVDAPDEIQQILLSLDYDDGFIAYLNGVEAARSNMNQGTVTHTTPAAGGREAGSSQSFDLTHLKPYLEEINVLAIEVHNTSINSSDLSCIPSLRVVYDLIEPPAPESSPFRINEIHSDTYDVRYVELYNTSDKAVMLDGCYLSNEPSDLSRFMIPANTEIDAHGYLSFDSTELGFTLDSTDNTIYLTNPSLDSVVDAVTARPVRPGWSVGRWPDGAPSWKQMPPSEGRPNTSAPTPQIVINEIMYNPPSGHTGDEYLELYNASDRAIDLSFWELAGGIGFSFPDASVLLPDSYLVIAKDKDRLIERYGLESEQVLGNFTGVLSNDNDTLILRDSNGSVVDRVRYWEGGHWPRFADGYGSSLELTDPLQDNSNYQVWKASNETTRAEWTFVQYQGLLSPVSDPHEHEIQFHLMGPGIVLIDDIRLMIGGTDFLGSGGFEQGLDAWTIMGTHRESHRFAVDAKEGQFSLRIVADHAGDTGANHIEKDCDRPVPAGQATLSFWAKWQYGSPVLVSRFWKDELAETTLLPRPQQTGTPGAVNSVYESNSGPVFAHVSHHPVVPTPADNVIIQAQVDDPEGIRSVALFYKADSQDESTWATMQDNGLFPDQVPGDGLYSAELPAQSGKQTVAFYLLAIDETGHHRTWPRDTGRPAHYRVETAQWLSPFERYRILTSADEEADLYSTPHMSNATRNCTFIYNDREIYYNCGLRLIGSSYHRRDNRNPAYTGHKVTFNSDEKLNGVKRQVRVDFLSNAGYRDRINYDLLQKMGHPSTLTKWVAVRVNDHDYGINEDMLPPNKRYLNTFFPGASDGELFELMPHFYYTDDRDDYFASHNPPKWDWTYRGPDKDPYRWYLRIRNHDIQDDYSRVVAAVEAFARIPNIAYSAVERHFDMTQYLGMLAIRAVNSNTDFKGNKNCYIYAPSSTHTFQLLAWDCEASFNKTSLDLWSSFIGPVANFLRFGRNQHDYLNIIHQYINSYFTRDHLDPWADHYFSVAGGLNPTTFKNFVTNRRNYILSILSPYTAPNVSFLLTQSINIQTQGLTRLSGLAPVNTSWIRINDKLYWLDWLDETHWTVRIDTPGDSDYHIEFLDYSQSLLSVIAATVTPESDGRPSR